MEFGHLEGEQPQLGDLLTMVANYLQVLGWSSKYDFATHEELDGYPVCVFSKKILEEEFDDFFPGKKAQPVRSAKKW